MNKSFRLVLVTGLSLLMLLAMGGVVAAHGDKADADAAKPAMASMQQANKAADKAEAAAPSQISVTLARQGDKAAVARAQLKDASGQPVTSAPVQFQRRTTFGTLLVETVKTGDDGSAEATLQTSPGQQIEVTARFAGDKALKPSEAKAQLSLPAAPAPALQSDLLTPHPNPWYVFALIVVVGGVWGTYGWIYFYVMRRIKAAGAGGP